MTSIQIFGPGLTLTLDERLVPHEGAMMITDDYGATTSWQDVDASGFHSGRRLNWRQRDWLESVRPRAEAFAALHGMKGGKA